MRTVLFIICLLLPTLPCAAQIVEPQTRIVFHTTADVTDHWFVTNWMIGNIKGDSPNNINLFPGIGYGSGKWWFEAMIQRQWSKTGNSWSLDFRYVLEPSARVAIYAESAPLLSQLGEYEFVSADFQIARQFAIGVETENVHSSKGNSVGLGPHLRFPIIAMGSYKLALIAAYQVRVGENNVPRLYVVLNRRFRRS